MKRRDFLKLSAAALGGMALQPLLSGCQAESPAKPAPTSAPSQAAPIATSPDCTPEQPCSTPRDTLSPTLTADSTTKAEPTAQTEIAAPGPVEPAQPSASPHLAVARGSDPETIVRKAIAALGGIERFVAKNAQVIIKPNICTSYHSYEYAATTNPWVVGALVKLCLEAGAKQVQVMDGPFGGTPDNAYRTSGIAEQVEAAGGKMVVMPAFKFVRADIPFGLDIREWQVYEDILNADAFIDVPIAKHHNLARLTLGMKNLMGVVLDRGGLHRNLGQRLADLASRLTPTLTVIDAVRILTANGPTGGSLDDVKQLDTVIASADIVAADSFAATLFDLRPSDLDYVRAAAAMNLGHADLENLVIENIAG